MQTTVPQLRISVSWNASDKRKLFIAVYFVVLFYFAYVIINNWNQNDFDLNQIQPSCLNDWIERLQNTNRNTGCPMTLFQYFRHSQSEISHERVIFSSVIELFIFEVRDNLSFTWNIRITDENWAKYDYRCTYSVTRHTTCQSTRDAVPEWAVPWPMDWSWW